MPQENQKEIFTGLSWAEKEFILNLFSKVQINITDGNAVEVCSTVKSITEKFQKEKDGTS